MSEVTITAHGVRTGRIPVRRDRLNGLLVVLVGAAVCVVFSQLHHHYAPKDAGGWREAPFYLISGAIGWLVAFGLGYIAPHRAVPTATVSRRTAVVEGAFAIVTALVLFYTPIGLCLAVGAVWLARRAATEAGPARLDRIVQALAVVAVLVWLAVFVVRIAGAM